MLMAVLLVFTGCEEESPVLEQSEPTELLSGKELQTMTQEELADYFEIIDLTQIQPGYIETWTDTLSAEEFAKYKSVISLRSSEKCGVVVTPYIDPGGPDSAYVTIFEAGTSNVYRAKEKFADGDDFWMEIDGADFYDFVTEHPTNPTGSIDGYLEIDPDWGGKTLAFFSGSGPHTYSDYNFECPPDSPDGTCDAYLEVRRLAGSATDYTIEVHPDVDNEFDVGTFTGSPSQSIPFTCDQAQTYEFKVKSSSGGASESLVVSIIRPDGIAHSYNMFGVDLSNSTSSPVPFTNDFDFFDCPY